MEVQPFIKRTPIFFALKLLKFGRTSNKIIKEKIKASNLPETRFGACAMLYGRA